MTDAPRINQASQKDWLAAAYAILTSRGIDGVKVSALASETGLTRTGFYWHFKDLNELLNALIKDWEAKNTGNLIAQSERVAKTITEAILYISDCWLDDQLFDARLDLAVRNWARTAPDIQDRIDLADQRRTAAIAAMFRRHGYSPDQADRRALTVIYTQIGYISMQVIESWSYRVSQMPGYVEVFTGLHPSDEEIQAFTARH